MRALSVSLMRLREISGLFFQTLETARDGEEQHESV